MNYRKDKYGNELSALGFGCLRFPQKRGKIDYEQTKKQIVSAIEQGVNYFDTAYIYTGSEATLGQVLKETGLRDRVNIATKLPHYLIKSRESLDKIFAEELRRLQTDRVEYYLMHMLNDADTWQRLKAMGIESWIAEKKTSGAIGQIGFSYHGNSEMFCKVLDAYDWDFCQIQYNYQDEHSQAGRRGLLHAAGKGIPVIIMEPLRGGRLVHMLPEKARKIFADYPVKRSPAEWGLRWLWDQKEVTVVLSGMNSQEMVNENIRVASQTRTGELSQQDMALYAKVVEAINDGIKVGCTGCGYCQPCPKGVDIPGTFAAYNRCYSEGWFWGIREHFMNTALRKTSTAASNCIGCGKCEKHCPQSIQIRKELKNAQKKLEGPVYKVARWGARWFTKF